MPKPTAAELAAAAGRTIPDVVGPGLRVLFSGINPSLYSAATGHHFARPGNRFAPMLHRADFTDRQLHPPEQDELSAAGLGRASCTEAGERGCALCLRKAGRTARKTVVA